MREDAHGSAKKFMEWETWKQALNGLIGHPEEIHLCPHWLGEPTIHPEFDRFVEYAFAINNGNKIFREFKLHTNAVVFNAARSRLLLRMASLPFMAKDTFRFIHFSIDAFSAESYKDVKGADRRDIVYKNIEQFLNIRKEMGLIRPHVALAFVVQPGNSHEAILFLNHWQKILTKLDAPFKVCSDWPDTEMDHIYFRRLNSGNQDASDKLHAQTIESLEIGLVQKNRRPESF